MTEDQPEVLAKPERRSSAKQLGIFFLICALISHGWALFILSTMQNVTPEIAGSAMGHATFQAGIAWAAAAIMRAIEGRRRSSLPYWIGGFVFVLALLNP